MQVDTRKQRARDVLTAMESGDGPAIVARLAEDARFWPPKSAVKRSGIAHPLVGAQAIAALFTRAKHFEQMHWETTHLLAEGDLVSIHTRMRGRMKNGKDYDNTHLWLFRFDGERVAEAWEYADTAYAFELMGI
jgi:ketosteroid isomerase-like protein